MIQNALGVLPPIEVIKRAIVFGAGFGTVKYILALAPVEQIAEKIPLLPSTFTLAFISGITLSLILWRLGM